MTRKKVLDLAKEWGADAKELVTRLEKLGVRNKRAQSPLSDEEIEKLRTEMGLGDKPGVAIGNERILTGSEGQTVVERRVGTNVIRRRATRSESAPMPSPVRLDSGPLPDFVESLPPPTGTFDTLLVPEALPEIVPTSDADSEPATLASEPSAVELTEHETAPPPITPAPAATATPAVFPTPTATPRVTTPARVEAAVAPPMLSEGMRGPRVLGRSDLKKIEAPAQPAE
ncbi:MAG: translation initiation factor IF-2 N-terminal domain-containing protein, partial [Deltaproteobacteria bacterium]|nr:translation initiation factor IF-2 N-terminal domain-containing protein [Deltaproteobacteria bacterium]